MAQSKDGITKTYCIIGDPVDHSLSPAMHNAAFKALNLNCTYIAFRVTKDELEAAMQSLRKTAVAGLNVTMPHKISIMKLLDDLEETCIKISAVNTVNNENGRFKGYNTDLHGFIQPLKRRNVKLDGKVALLMGAGGAARSVLTALAEEHVGKVILANRNVARAKDAAEHAKKLKLNCDLITLHDARKFASKAYLIVNATPVGMDRGPGLIKPEDIGESSVVYDLVYKPMETGLIRSAKEAGATVIYGYEMLIEQGAKSFEIWKGMEAPRDVMEKTLVGQFV
ncbi:MAG: shikimate dehydrogenase [Nitrososphaerales archaeon]